MATALKDTLFSTEIYSKAEVDDLISNISGGGSTSGSILTDCSICGMLYNCGTISGGNITGCTLGGRGSDAVYGTLGGWDGTLYLYGDIYNSGTIYGGTIRGGTIDGSSDSVYLYGDIYNSGTIYGGTIDGSSGYVVSLCGDIYNCGTICGNDIGSIRGNSIYLSYCGCGKELYVDYDSGTGGYVVKVR